LSFAVSDFILSILSKGLGFFEGIIQKKTPPKENPAG